MKRSLLAVILFALLSFIVISNGFTFEEDYTSKVTIGLDAMLGNDSNIIETSDEVNDNFFTIIPKIAFTRTREDSLFYLSYMLRSDNYFEESKFNNTSHNVDLKGRVNMGENFTLMFTDTFIDSVYGLWRAETDSTSGDGYLTNHAIPSLKYEASSGLFAFNLFYNYSFEQWDTLSNHDWTMGVAGTDLMFALGSFTQLGVYGNFTTKDFKDILTDYTGYSAGVKVDHSIPELFDITAKVGIETRDYSDLNEDDTLTSYELSFAKLFSETTSTRFTVNYQFTDSEIYIGEYYTGLGAKLDFSYLLQDKIQLFLRGEYLNNSYKHMDREDTVTRIYPGIGYKLIDWLALQLFYNFSQRDSNLDEFDINDSRIEFHLNFTKDFLF